MGRQRYAVQLISIVSSLLILGGGCSGAPDLLQRALGRDIASTRSFQAEARCPQITIFKVSPETVKCGDQVTLEVAATGNDPEKIFYTWDIEGQSFETGQRAIWNTPESTLVDAKEKIYTVRSIVSDGECSVTQAIDVKVLCPEASGQYAPKGPMVHFAFGKATLDANAKARLDEIVEQLQHYPDHIITIEGHTDYVGNTTYNRHLGQKRAEAVKNYLVQVWKIPASRIVTRSYGESVPIAPNETETGRAQNRRAEVFRVLFTTKEE